MPRTKMMKTKLTTKAQDILRKAYTRRIVPDETGVYTASILEFPGCVASGSTLGEAFSALERAAESWVEVALANGYAIREPIDFDGYSGKVALRIPRTLHRQVAEHAELEGVSINQLLVHAISHYVGAKQIAHEIKFILNRTITTNTTLSFAFPAGTGRNINTMEHVTQNESALPPFNFSNQPLPASRLAIPAIAKEHG